MRERNWDIRHYGEEKTINVCGRIGDIVTTIQISKRRIFFFNQKASTVPSFVTLAGFALHFC
jgi:hypothetical protein